MDNTPYVRWDERSGAPRRVAPTQNGVWILEPYYKFCTAVAINPARDQMFSEFGVPYSADTKLKSALDLLRKKFSYPIWLHCLIPPLGLTDSKNVVRQHCTSSIIVIDIITDKPMTYAQRKNILNSRLPVLGINVQPVMGSAYTTPTVPESHAQELCYCLENLRDDNQWATMYAGVVSKKLSSPYDIHPLPTSAAASRSSLFWHFHPFDNQTE